MGGLGHIPSITIYILEVTHCGQESRADRIEEICRKQYGDSPPPVSSAYNRILVDKKNKVLYCVIPKTGCSTWKTLFVNLSGKSTVDTDINIHRADINQYGLRYLKDYPTVMREHIFNDESYLKFIVVRNPFDRFSFH